MVKVPAPLSKGEATFAQHLKAYQDSVVWRAGFHVAEYRFCDRRWRFDFAFPSIRLAIEIDGGTAFGKSRHSRGVGYENDCRKYNAAATLGWKVLRFTTHMVESGEAIQTLITYLKEN